MKFVAAILYAVSTAVLLGCALAVGDLAFRARKPGAVFADVEETSPA